MNQQQARTIDVLNELYAAERRSLLPRLAETGSFVSWASAGEQELVRRMVADEYEHLEWLVDAMDCCCGVIYPAGPDVHIGHLHYLDLHAMLPLVTRSLENLVKVYQGAASQPLTAPAGEVVSRILTRHQAHLEQIRNLQTRAAAGVA
jgi:hypothetical protein